MKYFKISAVLCLISLVCAAIIASMNMLTSPIIADNNAKAELETCQAIFADYDQEKSVEIELTNEDKAIVKKVLAKNSANEELGYLYTVSGKNAYGTISLIVAIKNNTVYQVEFLENSQSFASTVNDHVKEKYPSSKDDSIIISPYPQEEKEIASALDASALDALDTKCGATYGANTVKELVKIAFYDAIKEVK
ncbi:MAG: hypothetical protein ACI35S_08655 [Anaeroplasma sp.]